MGVLTDSPAPIRIFWGLLFCLALSAPASAQSNNQWNLASMFGFEYGIPGSIPSGWIGPFDGSAATDCQVAHSGQCSARLAGFSGSTTYVEAQIPVTFSPQTIVFTGWVKSQNVNGVCAFEVVQTDANSSGIGSATTKITQGTSGWTLYSVSLPVKSQATQVIFAFYLSGSGTAWLDDLQLQVDGQPLAPSIPAGFSSDHDFDNGSGIAIPNLSNIQIQNLAVLAKIWGFLKYHHPAVTSGQNNWDYELFRVLPAVLAAADTPTANQAISDWFYARLGAAAPCNPCATLDTASLYKGPNLNWISDTSLLGATLSQALQSVYTNRTPVTQTFFASLSTGVGNPFFQFEPAYASLSLPDSGYQLLSLFRAWNMLEYFYPDLVAISEDPSNSATYWDGVLQQAIPGFATAQSNLAYQQVLLQFTARINDTHSSISNLYNAQPPTGFCQLPVQIRYVEGSPVVVGYLSADGAGSGLQVGDVLQQLDGAAVADLVTQWTPYYADSNQAARLRDIANYMTQGNCGPAAVSVLRMGQPLGLTVNRVATENLDLTSNGGDDLPGSTFQMLSPDVAYLKLSSLLATQSAGYIQAAAGTKGLIIDIRNYPSDFVVFKLGDLLVSDPVNFVQFTNGDVTNPGAFHWAPPLGLTPAQPHYAGKIVILVDEFTQSQAEYTAMAFRAAPGAVVVGSTTAGADGNVSMVPLPGAFYFYFSGLGVYYPDHTPTQRVGIVPDVVVTRTIAGIQAGRDEVLDAAIGLIGAAPMAFHREN